LCEQAGVTFHLGTEVSDDLIEEELPDTVVLATGPVYSKIEAPGGGGEKIVNLLDVMNGKVEVGDTVVMYGNRKPGIGGALHLAKQGKKVTIVGKEKSAGFDVNPSFKWRYMIYMRQNGITVYNDCDIEEVTDEGVIAKAFDGVRWPIKCDTVVISDRGPNESLKNGYRVGIRL
jgi:pyruvate/2-oxoglutarate dehydrogenase complex dihydrolipoamide dehydrogenase (E3) component